MVPWFYNKTIWVERDLMSITKYEGERERDLGQHFEILIIICATLIFFFLSRFIKSSTWNTGKKKIVSPHYAFYMSYWVVCRRSLGVRRVKPSSCIEFFLKLDMRYVSSWKMAKLTKNSWHKNRLNQHCPPWRKKHYIFSAFFSW